MNKRICKALRQLARDSLPFDAPAKRLVVNRNKGRVENSMRSVRGVYRALKGRYQSRDREIVAKIDAVIGYTRVLRANTVMAKPHG
jgi:hypothetical protein